MHDSRERVARLVRLVPALDAVELRERGVALRDEHDGIARDAESVGRVRHQRTPRQLALGLAAAHAGAEPAREDRSDHAVYAASPLAHPRRALVTGCAGFIGSHL